jgi:DNA-binding response OmpR family regulator
MNKNRKTILIIDDEEDFSFFTKKNLERNNYQVLAASEGESGLRAAFDAKPDLILLDIMMPGIDGFEVLKRLKADQATAHIPVIMLTGKDDEVSKERAAALDDADYLVKPIVIEELHEKIEGVFGLK